MLRSCTRALAAFAAAACHTYTPAPVDLGAHAAAFLDRLPTPAALAAAGRSAAPPAGAAPVDLADGIDRREAVLIALCFHPDCRLARERAGIAGAEAEHAGTLPDPELSLDVARILESVPHPWVLGGALGFTVPWNGRLQLQRQLADARLAERLLDAHLTESARADAVDAAWLRWSHQRATVDVLTTWCASLRDLAAIADRLAQAGSLMHQGARVFTLELTQRELELAVAEDAAATGELELKRELGLHPAAPVTFVPDRTIAPRRAEAAARAAGLADSPRVLAARAAHHVAEADLELAVRRQWPDLVLAPGVQEEDAQPRAALGFALPLPLFAGNDAAIARETAARAAAAEALRGSFELATQELALAELQWQQTQRRARFAVERLVPLADQQLADGRRLAELGTLEPLLLLDALSRAHEARLTALDAALQEALAVVTLNTRSAIRSADADAGVSR